MLPTPAKIRTRFAPSPTGYLHVGGAPSVLSLGFALHGSAWGLRGPFMQAIRADYFGRRSIGMILGLSSIIVVMGQIGGPMVAGVLADLTGNYRAGFTLLALLAGLGSLFFLLAVRPGQGRRQARVEIRARRGSR